MSDTDSDEEDGEIAEAGQALEMTSAAALSWGLWPSAPIGTVEGQLEVDAVGAAVYSMPIRVPPGFGGVEPKLSLQYRSTGGNGIVGVGFDVAGLSKITRCPRTIAQDGARGAVSGGADDRFCLDGQRLVPISGVNGANGAEYRTEIDSGARIKGVGNCNSGPCSFTVTAKDGTVSELGATVDSRPAALVGGVASGPVRAWGVDKITSPSGAYMLINYRDWGDGTLYPNAVTYTMHSAAPTARERWVKFEWEDRPDVESAYVNGAKILTGKRLAGIYTYVKGAGDVLVKGYKLQYTLSPDTSRSLVSKVEECDPTACLPATTFQWPTEGGKDFTWAYPTGQPGDEVYQHNLRYHLGANLIPGDFDGDGKTDFIRQEKGVWDDDAFGTFQIYYSRGTNDGRFDVVTPVSSGINNYGLDMKGDDTVYLIPGDFNGDGRTDFIRQSWWNGVVNGAGYFRVYYATAQRGVFQMFQPTAPDHQYAFVPWGAAIIPTDHNGDGKTDFIRLEQGDWADDVDHQFRVYLASAADGVFDIREPNDPYLQAAMNPFGAAMLIPGDHDGDGRVDFIRQERDDWDNSDFDNFSVHLSKGDGYFTRKYYDKADYQHAMKYDAGAQIIPGDFNGDGKADFIRQERDDWDNDNDYNFEVYFARGNGEFDIVYPTIPGYQDRLAEYQAFILPLDYNGDGKTDFLRQEHNQPGADVVGTFQIYISKGDGTFRIEEPGAYEYQDLMRADPGCVVYTGDYNGDGRDDFVRQDKGYWADDDTFTFSVYLANGPKGGDLVKGITDGLGATTTIEYAPLSDSAVHTPAAGALVEGAMSLRRPLYVVKKYERSDRAGIAAPEALDRFRHEVRYEGAQVDRLGRGFLGFASISDKDLATNTTTTTRYHQAFPLVGVIAQREVQYPDGEKVTTTITTHATPQPAPVSRVWTAKEEVTHASPSASYTTATEYEVDAYGNAALVHHRGLLADPGDDYDTCTKFSNDASLWRIGYPLTITDDVSCALQADGSCDCGLPNDPTFLSEERRVYSADGRMSLTESWRFDDANQIWLKTFYQYDALGNVIKRTDPDGSWENTTYDATDRGFPVKVERCGQGVACRSQLFAYDPRFGLEAARTDENGVVISRAFDAMGRVRTTWAWREGGPEQLTDEGLWLSGGWPVRFKSVRTAWGAAPAWATESEYLDGFGRTVRRIASAEGVPLVFSDFDYLSGTDRVALEKAPFTVWAPDLPVTTTQYDGQGRPVQIQEPAGLVTNAYSLVAPTADCAACVVEVTVTEPAIPDVAGANVPRTTHRYLDPEGRTRKQVDADGHAAWFEYDRLGRKTRAADEASASTLTYDSLGRVLTTNSADRGSFVSKYDARGLLEQTADARGLSTHYHHDGLGRLTKKEIPGTEDVVYEYEQGGHVNAIGRLTTVSVMAPGQAVSATPRSRYKFHYTPEGRPGKVIAYVDGFTYTLETQFDAVGRSRAITHPGDWTISRTYDGHGNLTEAKMDLLATPAEMGPAATWSDYNAAGQPGKVSFKNYSTLPNGSSNPAAPTKTSIPVGHTDAVYTYDAAGRIDLVTSTRHRDGLPDVKTIERDYTWLPGGLVSKIEDKLSPGLTEQFVYTPAGKLRRAQGIYGVLDYDYDEQGRLADNGGTGLGYSGHRLTASSAPSASGPISSSYTHDAAGNRTGKSLTGEVWQYAYDGAGRLANVTRNGEQREAYTYAFSGERATKLDADGTKVIYLTPDVEITVLSSGARLNTIYLSGPAGRVAAYTKEMPSGSTGGSLVPFEEELSKWRIHDPRTIGGILAIAATGLSAWRLHPGAPLHAALGIAALLALGIAAASRGPRGRRALSRALALYRTGWLARFDTRFVREHRRYALMVPVVLASFVAGCQPAGGRGAPDERVDSAEEALVGGANGAGNPVVGTQYFQGNHVGSATTVTDEAGEWVASTQFKPFGEMFASWDGTDSFRIKYGGKEWDRLAGVYYFNARYYDPLTAQFMTPDSYLHGGPETSNVSLDPFAYAGNNPVVYADPSGHDFGIGLLIICITAAVVGAYMAGSAANGTYDPTRWEASTKTWVALGIGAATGAMSGGIGAAGGVAAGMAAGFVSALGTETARQIGQGHCDAGELYTALLIGTMTGGVAGRAGQAGRGFGAKLVTQTRPAQRWTTYAQDFVPAAAAGLTAGAVNAIPAAVRAGVVAAMDTGGAARERAQSSGNAAAAGLQRSARPEERRERSMPIELTRGGQDVERLGQGMLRASSGLASLVPLAAPIRGNDTASWKAASAPR